MEKAVASLLATSFFLCATLQDTEIHTQGNRLPTHTDTMDVHIFNKIKNYIFQSNFFPNPPSTNITFPAQSNTCTDSQAQLWHKLGVSSTPVWTIVSLSAYTYVCSPLARLAVYFCYMLQMTTCHDLVLGVVALSAAPCCLTAQPHKLAYLHTYMEQCCNPYISLASS